MELKVVQLTYDLEEDLPLSYGHKLRGYFAHEFEEVLFHQHKKDGGLRYKYPLIQYKIINNKPVIIGLGSGGDLIIEHFLSIDKIVLGDKKFLNPSGKLKVDSIELKVNNKYDMPPYKYSFISPWLGLSQKNYNIYKTRIEGGTKDEKVKFLKKIITGNILSFAKGVGWWIEESIITVPKLREIPVNFKNQTMIGFVGEFYSNVFIPEYIGLGKSTSRGFGTLRREKII
ncbi:CRISPR-associated endonuclease Cas6 [Halothermothrix orenii]|uniref:DNA repair protein n=1 Tax=Halothermothrix orenii (strain H 168 / OCM 544 / DSM 9562) TaxID=373903 RepID=B8CY98_HALOH|nr:CRISPR-associated endonuclease Cas6 [Halothermothrix orenii]ACL70267.1 hypothetical protein Hore_15180 [Halothermothrix orenii H 168]